VREIGLFPLGIVLLPGEQVPLHIFEPRYRELIGECLDEGASFGLVFADESGLREIGTEAAVVEVLERFADGRLNIVVEGGERFRLLELTDGRSFATAEIDAVPDGEEHPTQTEVERCLAAYQRVLAVSGEDAEVVDVQSERLAYRIAARAGFGAPEKQKLLELTSERERVVRLAGLLERAAETVRRNRQIRERASSNGRVEPV